MTRDELDAAARRLWLLVREQVGPTPAAAQDQRRLQAALAERRTKSQEFFSSSAGQWDRLRDELFGDRFHLAALAALRRSRLGASAISAAAPARSSAALAPFVAARDRGRRLGGRCCRRRKKRLQRVRQRRSAPRRARSAADRRCAARRGDADAGAASRAGAGARAGRSGARAQAGRPRSSSSTCCRTIARATASRWATCGSGFSDDHMQPAARARQDSSDVRIVPLPPDARAKGPGLFVATARRSRTSET